MHKESIVGDSQFTWIASIGFREMLTYLKDHKD